MAASSRIPAQNVVKTGAAGSPSVHWFKFDVGASGAITAATLKQSGDGFVKSLSRPGAGRYTITINAPGVIDILNCKVTYAKAGQTDAEVFGHYKVGSLTTGSAGTHQTFEIFFATSAAAAADVPTGATVMVEVVEVPNKVMGTRVDN